MNALANGRGGAIILGVSEAEGFRPVPGFDAVRMQEALADVCADKLQPPLRPEIEIVDLPDGQVVAAEIEPLPPFDKPCWVKSKGRYGGSFIRTGEGDQRLSEDEVLDGSLRLLMRTGTLVEGASGVTCRTTRPRRSGRQ